MPEPVPPTWQDYADAGLALAGSAGVLLSIVLGLLFARLVWGN